MVTQQALALMPMMMVMIMMIMMTADVRTPLRAG